MIIDEFKPVDGSVAKQSKQHEEIISNLLDPRVPKTEREHAAVKEIERLRTLIIRLKKPAALINFNAATGEQNVSFECESELASIVRQPLTDEQIDALILPESGTGTIRDIVRIIEAAHGIGGNDD